MMKGDHRLVKLLHALTWGAFNHASHAPQVRACKYYIQYVMSTQCLKLIHVHTIYDIIINSSL